MTQLQDGRISASAIFTFPHTTNSLMAGMLTSYLPTTHPVRTPE